MNSCWLSCLRYSNINLIVLYHTRNTPAIWPGSSLLFFFCLYSKYCPIPNKSNHSPKAANMFVFTLNTVSIWSYICRMCVFVNTVVSRCGRFHMLLGTMIPYSSWFKKFPILPKNIPNGTKLRIVSPRLLVSDRLHHCFQARVIITVITAISQPIKDIHHFQNAIIWLGCCTK